MNSSNSRRWIEQLALLAASFVWTLVVLVIVVLFWLYQDVQAHWDFVLNSPPEALAQAAPPTATPWPGPPPTLTPTATQPPTPTATWVIGPPEILPETFVSGEPTPVIIATIEAAPELNPPEPQPLPQLATATPAPPTPNPVLIPAIPTPTSVPPNPTPLPPAPPQPGETAPTRLVIEAVGINSEVIPVGWQIVEENGRQYSIWEVADFAVGWHKTSALLGQPGNTVMAGHNNINGEVFRDLVNVELGDRVVTYAGEKKFEYEVTFKTIVKEKGEPPEVRQRNAQWIAPTADERLTLVTCWPYTSNTHRVIVVAQPV